VKGKIVPAGQLLAVTVGLVIALGLRPASTREIVAAYVLALSAIAFLTLARMGRTADEWDRATSELEHALAPQKVNRVRPTELIRVERDLTLSILNAGELHARLLPKLREVAAARLLLHHDVSLPNAHELLGDDAWDLLRPDRPAPQDRSAPGVPLPRIAALVETIEHL
jgi:hypothetical protein